MKKLKKVKNALFGQNRDPNAPEENEENPNGAERSQDQRTQKEEKRGRTSPPGTSSKENQGGKTAVGKDQLDNSLTRPRDDTESGREEEAKVKSDCNQEKKSVQESGKQKESVGGLRLKVIASDIERSRLSTYVSKIPRSIYGTVCRKLNSKDEMFCKDFRMLGEKLGYTKEETRFLDREVTTNPTDELFDFWCKSDLDATVEKLIQRLKEKDLERMDVVKILEGWVQGDPRSRTSTKVTGIPFDIYSKVCLMLNTEDKIFYRDYRMLGEKLGYDPDKISGFEQGSRNPTHKLIKKGFKRNDEPLTVQRFIELLKEEDMTRVDVTQILEDWVKTGLANKN